MQYFMTNIHGIGAILIVFHSGNDKSQLISDGVKRAPYRSFRLKFITGALAQA